MFYKLKRNWVWAGLILAFLAIAALRLSSRLPEASQAYTATPSIATIDTAPPSAFVHLFEWTWDDIGEECEAFLGSNGYDGVQISPPNEHVVLSNQGYPWWQRYQPVSYKLMSRSGDRTQLRDMVERCHAAGVKVYADAVINHMAAIDSGIGSGGTAYRKYNHPNLYKPSDFHPCRRPIETYQDRAEVTTCELVGLADLKTGSATVQATIVDYLADLADLGIDGFRIDAAKHIAAYELGDILDQLHQRTDRELYIYQEVIDPGTEVIKKDEYYGNGAVHEFEYGRLVSEVFLNEGDRTLAQLNTLGEDWGLVPTHQSVIFIDNHDKQRGHGGGGNYLTYKNGTLYELANVFMLAHPYGYPQVMSSYAFDDTDQGPPTDSHGATQPVFVDGQSQCFAKWQCEHRWPAIARMVKFRRATHGQPLTHWWSDGANQIAFGRGNVGFVVINRSDRPLHHTFQTGLRPGTYCNILQPSAYTDPQACTDAADQVVVDETGQTTLSIEAMAAAAIYTPAES